MTLEGALRERKKLERHQRRVCSMILISIKMRVSTGKWLRVLVKQSQPRTNAFSGHTQACIVAYKLMAWLFKEEIT